MARYKELSKKLALQQAKVLVGTCMCGTVILTRTSMQQRKQVSSACTACFDAQLMEDS